MRAIWFADAYSDRNCNTYAHAYSKAFAYAAERTDTAGASDSAAPPVAASSLRCWYSFKLYHYPLC